MLAHPAIGQAHRLWIKPSSRFTRDDIEGVAECPRIRLLGEVSFVHLSVSPAVGDAILSILAPTIKVGGWETGTPTHIDSDR